MVEEKPYHGCLLAESSKDKNMEDLALGTALQSRKKDLQDTEKDDDSSGSWYVDIHSFT